MPNVLKPLPFNANHWSGKTGQHTGNSKQLFSVMGAFSQTSAVHCLNCGLLCHLSHCRCCQIWLKQDWINVNCRNINFDPHTCGKQSFVQVLHSTNWMACCSVFSISNFRLLVNHREMRVKVLLDYRSLTTWVSFIATTLTFPKNFDTRLECTWRLQFSLFFSLVAVEDGML